jgi:hypothetical protein
MIYPILDEITLDPIEMKMRNYSHLLLSQQPLQKKLTESDLKKTCQKISKVQ